MKRTWSIGRKLFVSIGLLALLVLTGSAVSVWSSHSIKTAQDRTVGKARAALGAAEVEGYVRALKGAQMQILAGSAADNASLTDQGESHVDELHEGIGAMLEELTAALDADARAQVLSIRADIDAWMQNHEAVASAAKAKNAADAIAIDRKRCQPLIASALAAVEKLQNELDAEFEREQAVATGSFGLVFAMSLGILIVSGLATVGVAYLVRRTTKGLTDAARELRQNSEQVVSAATQVSTSSQSLSQGATEQAASLEETSASMEEMSSMTRQNAENSREAATLVTESSRQIGAANSALRELVSSMQAIRESSDKVTKIIKTIDEIAFQTNILALNAAVEAARAGEAGMGFAVVADEVRSLAQRAGQAAKDTATLIEESVGNSQHGTVKVNAVEAAISSMTESAARLTALVEGVSNASREQTQGIEQVTQAVSQMEQMTQSTAASAEQSAAAAQQLQAQAELSMRVIGRLESLVGAQVVSSRTRTRRRAGRLAQGTRTVVSLPQGETARDPLPMNEAGEATGTFGSF